MLEWLACNNNNNSSSCGIQREFDISIHFLTRAPYENNLKPWRCQTFARRWVWYGLSSKYACYIESRFLWYGWPTSAFISHHHPLLRLRQRRLREGQRHVLAENVDFFHRKHDKADLSEGLPGGGAFDRQVIASRDRTAAHIKAEFYSDPCKCFLSPRFFANDNFSNQTENPFANAMKLKPKPEKNPFWQWTFLAPILNASQLNISLFGVWMMECKWLDRFLQTQSQPNLSSLPPLQILVVSEGIWKKLNSNCLWWRKFYCGISCCLLISWRALLSYKFFH